MTDPTHGPIVEEQRERMNALASGLDNILNGVTLPSGAYVKKVAFVLLVANFGEIDGGRVNYISNGARADIIAMLHEILARFEGRASDTPGHA